MLRVGMQFVTLCVTRRFFFVRWIGVRLRSPFRPSATYFDGAKVSKPPGSVSGPTSSGSFALPLIRGSPQRTIHGPVRLAWRPARLPPDQRQGSAVTYVAICVVSAIVVEKRFCSSGCGFDYRSHAPRGNAVRDALRHTVVLGCQVDWCPTQVTFSPFGESLRWGQSDQSPRISARTQPSLTSHSASSVPSR